MAVRSSEQSSITDDDNMRFVAFEERLSRAAERMDRIEQELRDNNQMTREIRDVMVAGKVGLKVLGGVGIAVKWAGVLAAAALAVWSFVYALMHGAPPK